MENKNEGFGKRITESMEKAHIHNKELTEDLNLSKNVVGNCKNDMIPKAEILYMISQKLGTTMEYLLTGEEFNENSKVKNVTEEELELIYYYRNCTEKEKFSILSSAKTLANIDLVGNSSTSKTG